MFTKVKKIRDFAYRSITFESLFMISDQNGCLPILPLLYTTHLSRFGIVYSFTEFSDPLTYKRFSGFIEKMITESTITAYVYSLSIFLDYLERCKKIHNTPGMHSSSLCSEKFVNNYLNSFLPEQFAASRSIQTHQAALTAYFNWLHYIGLIQRIDLKISRKTRQYIAEKSQKPNHIQYISRFHFARLLNNCETLGEKLIFRMGYEVGLRTSEVAALRVGSTKKLVQLFKMLEDPDCDHLEQFSYLLEGKYTKGGKSRWIFFGRELLQDMYRYFQFERKQLLQREKKESDCFFIRRDRRFAGTGIGVEHASRVFRKTANKIGLNALLTFHDLRHTFATILFHSEIATHPGRETRSESAALIVVAQRLGHAFTNSGHAPATTTRYIRMHLQMLEMENI